MSDATPNLQLSDLVRRARLADGLTQVEFAEKIGMSQRWVSDLERNKFKTPRRDTMHRLAAALNIPVADVVIAVGQARTVAEALRVLAEPDASYRIGSPPPQRTEMSMNRRVQNAIAMLRNLDMTKPSRMPILEQMLRIWAEEDERTAAEGKS